MGRKRSSALVPGLLLTLLFLLPAAPRARAAADPFQEHYEQALQLYRDRRYEEAVRELKAAYALRADPRLLLNLGHACRHLKRPEEAIRYYRQYLEGTPDLSAEERRTAEIYLAQAQAQLRAASPPPPPAREPERPRPPAPRPQLLLTQPPARPPAHPAATPLYRQWWFWGIVGCVTAGTVVAAVLLSQPFGNNLPPDIPLHDARF